MRVEKYLRLYETDALLSGGFALSNEKSRHDAIGLEDGDKNAPGLKIRANWPIERIRLLLSSISFDDSDEDIGANGSEMSYTFTARLLYQIFTGQERIWMLQV